MIGALRGVILEKTAGEVVVDVGGVGYRVVVSTLQSQKLGPPGETVSLRIQTMVREDAITLYGFTAREEETLFLMLISVSNVGPKLAMAILSGLELDQLVTAIAQSDVTRLTRIHGVGKKTAERVILELKDKVKLTSGGVVPAAGGTRGDLVSALVNLGYKDVQAHHAAEQVLKKEPATAPLETLLKAALKSLRASN